MGISTPSGETIYGGEATGFVIHTPDGLPFHLLLSVDHHIYHCGDTGVFSDMKLINDLYTPDVALLCIGDFYTMGPKEASYAVNNVAHGCESDA